MSWSVGLLGRGKWSASELLEILGNQSIAVYAEEDID